MTDARKLMYKQGQVVVLNSGKYAGKKAVVLTNYFDGSKTKKFSHCLVAGVARYPRKITKDMSEQKIKRRIRVKPFVKYVNMNHLILTRYVVSENENSLKNLENKFNNQAKLNANSEVDKQAQKDPLVNEEFRKNFKKDIRKTFESLYNKLNFRKDQSLAEFQN